MRIEIKTNNFSVLTGWHVRRVLRRMSNADLQGLALIKIIDDCPNDPESAKVPAYMRGFLYNGHYSGKTQERGAEVVLYANDVYFGVPRLLVATPMATLKLARTLAHEIGHHVIATRGYIYDHREKYAPWTGKTNPKEEQMVQAYAEDVIDALLQHWPYKLGNWLLQLTSKILFKRGLRDYWHNNYQRAASCFARVHSLTPTNENAGQNFRHAMEKLKVKVPDSFGDAERHWLFHRYNATPMKTGKLRLKRNG